MKRSMRMATVAVAMVVGLSVGAGALLIGAGKVDARTSAQFAATVAYGQNFLLKSGLDSTFCMQTDGVSSSPPVYLFVCGTADNQRWSLTDGADGLNVVVGVQGLCLQQQKVGKGFQDLAMTPCTYKKSQQFNMADGQLEVGTTNLCAAVTAAGDYAQVALDTCDSTKPGQVWKLAH